MNTRISALHIVALLDDFRAAYEAAKKAGDIGLQNRLMSDRRMLLGILQQNVELGDLNEDLQARLTDLRNTLDRLKSSREVEPRLFRASGSSSPRAS